MVASAKESIGGHDVQNMISLDSRKRHSNDNVLRNSEKGIMGLEKVKNNNKNERNDTANDYLDQSLTINPDILNFVNASNHTSMDAYNQKSRQQSS